MEDVKYVGAHGLGINPEQGFIQLNFIFRQLKVKDEFFKWLKRVLDEEGIEIDPSTYENPKDVFLKNKLQNILKEI